MKILKYGEKDKSGVVMVFTCTNCGCEFEADRRECVEISKFQENGKVHEAAICRCPCCPTNVFWETEYDLANLSCQ